MLMYNLVTEELFAELHCMVSVQHTRHCARRTGPRRFTKALPGFKTLSYASRLEKLDLPSLEKRRLHSHLIMCYKIIFGIVNICTNDFFKFHTVMSTRGHPYKLFKERSTNTVRKNFFSQRVVNAWNYLPADTVDFRLLRSFTRTIKLVDFSSFLICF